MSRSAMNDIAANSLPTLYEHYTEGGVTSGLTFTDKQFKLNDRDIWLYSGAVHYFRVPKPYWRDRLRKVRASGLNAVETYVPWNLHEFQNGSYDFGSGGSDMQDFLDIAEFLKIAKEEDLVALVRPGPYICSEWEFGGLPSWLLRKKGIKVRSRDGDYMKYVERYFNMLLPILAALQFTKGGPVVAFQIENEYGSTEENGKVDDVYLAKLKEIMERNGLTEMFYTSDGISGHGTLGSVPGVLRTANFADNPEGEFGALLKTQPNKPLMCMEYWTGWFDHWSEKHHTRSSEYFASVLERIIKYPASLNLYMFHGGTNWGFMNGANIGDGGVDNKGFQPDTTSYDYDAPLTENGDYTMKYIRLKELLNKYNVIKTKLPSTPVETKRFRYQNINITSQLNLWEMEDQSYSLNLAKITAMEDLPINNNSGQSYGYILYRKDNLKLPGGSELRITGHVCDTIMVLVNGVLLNKPLTQNSDLDGFGYWRLENSSIILTHSDLENARLELLVENFGRNNFGALRQFNQQKGLWHGPVSVNNVVLDNWQTFPLEFKTKWTNTLTGWHTPTEHTKPSLYKGVFNTNDLYDTFIDMRGWSKGTVIVNGFVLGRHAIIGPQLALYLPAPLLRRGDNEILIFEHFKPGTQIVFSHDQIFNK